MNSQVIGTIREILVSVQFYKWYGFFFALISTFAAELIFTICTDEKEKIPHPFVRIIIFLFMYVFLYFFILMISVMLYVCIKKTGTINEILLRYWNEYKGGMIAVPIIVRFFMFAAKRRKKIWRILIASVLIAAMVFSQHLLTYPDKHIPIKDVLLSEFQEMPFPFVTKFYTPDNYYNYAKTPMDTSLLSNTEEKAIPDGNTENLSFDALLKNAQICFDKREDYLAEKYVDAAYDLYLAGEWGSPFYLGLMWYYKGRIENNASYYATAGQVYSDDQQWGNAALCYQKAYDIDRLSYYADCAVEFYYLANSSNQTDINELARLLCSMQSYYDDEIPYLDVFYERYPSEEAIQTVSIMRHIAGGYFDESDVECARRFLTDKKYWGGPKLKLVVDYSSIMNGESIDAEKWYTDSIENQSKYQPEDLLNTAWLLYREGEFGKAYQLAASAADDSGNVIDDAYLLIAEIFLQEESALPNLNSKALVERLSNIQSGTWYSEEDQLRFSIAAMLLSNSAGTEVDVGMVADMAQRLFVGDSFKEGFILATFDFEQGNFESCENRCDELLEMDISVPERHSVQFLLTDALIEYTKNLDTEDVELINIKLRKAKAAMEEIRSNVEGNYVECLRKLHGIYDRLGEDEQRDSIGKILQAFN